MSAQEIAIAAVSDVASSSLPTNRVPEFEVPGPSYDAATANMETPSAKRSFAADSQEEVGAGEVHSSSSNDSPASAVEAVTPPTSQEFSQSQESQSHLAHLSQIVAAQLSSQNAANSQQPLPEASTAGQKRTIEGYAKPSGSTSSESPDRGQTTGHSRNASTISAVSSTASTRELTSELRTRLSYAMMKVNKGWESLPIGEVESLASQAGSPTSSTSTVQALRQQMTSPRAVIANIQGRHQDPPLINTIIPAPNSSQEQASFSGSQPSRTYESFWREQSQKQPSAVSSSGSTNASLAPSADLNPTRLSPNPRRSHTPKVTKPPTLQTYNPSDLSQTSQVSAARLEPGTPSRTSHPVDTIMQTPTQKSVQERDAIETLLFMSSPGNSSTMGHTFPASQGRASQLQSPLRADFGPSVTGVHDEGREYTSVPLTATNGRENAIPINKHKGAPRRTLRDEDIDQLLDMPGDSEDSDSEEIEIPTPRRRTTTRPA